MPNPVGRISGPLLRSNLQRTDDLAFETDLLYINHSGNRIGINTDSPTRTLQVNGLTNLNDTFIATNSATLGNILFNSAGASMVAGQMSLTSTGTITMPELRIGDVYFKDNELGTWTTNSNLQLSSNGTGEIIIPTDLEVYGNINATGDILAEGNITVGDDSTDSLVIGADINSDLLPDATLTYKIGSSISRQWGEFYGVLGDVTDDVNVASLVSFSGITVNQPIANTYYVSSLGADTNSGQTASFAFASVEKALDEAALAGGNNLVFIMPGTYTEDFPLDVPANTTVRGQSMRSVTLQPSTSTQSKDAFLLNNACFISDLTVSNFYYDSINDTGYAFRFDTGINVTSKSPYIQNVSVITQGTVTSGSDPRGYDSHDAGKGAMVDGSVANSSSNQASMLFNAVTFITPGVDAVTMKNGVRVEFIDCFTYFANRSLYAVNGATGFAGLGVTFGAEVRVIASASIYGAIGAEADGNATLMYLINHNMAYVGSGKDVDNDVSIVSQDNEIVELNGGQIYYQTQDQSGNYRIGNTFVVNFNTGTLNFSPASFTFSGSSITVGVPGGPQTFIDAERITFPNFTISGNTVKSDINEINVISDSGNINFLKDVNISTDLAVSGNLVINGALINLGNQVTDTLDFETQFTSDIIPANNNLYNLGSSSKNWDNVYAREMRVGDITITDNFIAVNVSNEDLIVNANGTGKVLVDNLRFKTEVDSSSGVIDINNSNLVTNFSGKAMTLHVGNSAQRPNVLADLRYNNSTNSFEGRTTDYFNLGGVKDLDGNTRIELISDQFYFYADGVNTARIDTAGNLIANRFSSQNQFAVDSNTVTVGSSAPGTVAALQANGTGRVLFDTSNYVFNEGNIKNTVLHSDITLLMTGVTKEQKVEFRANSKGVRVPFGNTANRNPGVIGEIYYNTQTARLQVYTGTLWANAVGVVSGIVTGDEVQEINTIYNLILS